MSSPLLGRTRGGIVLLHLDILYQTVKGEEIVARREGLGAQVQALVGAIEDVVQRLFGEFIQRGVEGAAIFFTDGRYLPKDLHILVFAQRQDAAIADVQGHVGHDLVTVDDIDISQSLAMRAGAQGRVEREIVRCRFHVGQSRGGIHERPAIVAYFVGFGIEYHQLSVALLESQVNGVFQAFTVLVGHLQAIDNKFHTVVHIAVQLHAKGDFPQHPIDPDVDVSLLAEILEQVLVVSLAVLDKRGHDVDAVSLVTLHNQRQYLVDGVFHHALSRQVGIGVGSAGIQESQVVIDLGCGAHGAARVAVDRLLPYRDDGTQAGNLVHVGALEHPHHVTGIGREGFQVSALPLGKHGVKCQRRLAAATQPRHYREAVVRNLNVNVLEVVDSCPQHLNTINILPV